MRSNLVDGKLVEPISTLAAQLRHQQLAYEIGKIEREITASYDVEGRAEWRNRAFGCLGWLRREERLLAEWMATRGVEPLPPRDRAAPKTDEDDYAEFWRE